MKTFLIVIFVVSLLLLLFSVVNSILQFKFVSHFKKGNTIVSGLRGRGKDLAFCFVINKRKRNYISNVQYSNPNKPYKRFDFDTKVWELSGNTYQDMISGDIKSYVYPYPDDIDYYISDAGIYFPSQYHSELDKKYKSAPMFMALSRHLGDCNIHCNVQNQPRLWDKIREQSDIYIVMRGAYFIPKTKIFLCIYTTYSLAESASSQIKLPFFGFGPKARDRKLSFVAQHGEIKNGFFVARLKYNYDSRRFKKLLENNLKDYE